jgi:hypothetical protein
MKQAKFPSGIIVTSDDLDFEARSKNYSIEQTRFDLLTQQPITSVNRYVKGVVAKSGMTSGNENNPLMVYISNNKEVSVYSGVAYDGFASRSNRIWVPDIPADVPINPAAAVTNHRYIDMPDEVQTKDFTTATRPPREKVEIAAGRRAFSAADASGAWYACIKFVYGDYDPITISSDGSQEDSKRYESYEIRVSQGTAAQLYGIDGDPWMQLATLNWNGTILTLVSDDRVFASAITSLTDELLVTHQKFYHDSAIISTNHSLLLCSIDNTNHKVDVTNTTFTAQDGMNINGKFLQNLLTPYYAQFNSAVDATNYYWIYVDENGYIRKTVTEATARGGLPLCQVYYDQATNQIWRMAGVYSTIPYDHRHFGTITQRQLSNRILGEGWTEAGALTIKDLAAELISHRDNQHGNGIYTPLGSNFVYPATTGSLGANATAFDTVTISDLNGGDYLYLDGWQLNARYGNNQVQFTGADIAGLYVIYARHVGYLYPDIHAYILDKMLYIPPLADFHYPICTVNWDGVNTLTYLKDKRVYRHVGYAHVQRNNNASNMNTLPELLCTIWGEVTVGADSQSNIIYLTDNWGSGYGGGGTATGRPLFPIKPLIMVYEAVNTPPTLFTAALFGGESVGSPPVLQGYHPSNITFYYFQVRNYTAGSRTFYWIAIGPAVTNSLGNAVWGRDNPTHDV